MPDMGIRRDTGADAVQDREAGGQGNRAGQDAKQNPLERAQLEQRLAQLFGQALKSKLDEPARGQLETFLRGQADQMRERQEGSQRLRDAAQAMMDQRQGQRQQADDKLHAEQQGARQAEDRQRSGGQDLGRRVEQQLYDLRSQQNALLREQRNEARAALEKGSRGDLTQVLERQRADAKTMRDQLSQLGQDLDNRRSGHTAQEQRQTQDATRQHDQQATQDQRPAQDTARQHTQDASRQHDQQATQDQRPAQDTARQHTQDTNRQHDQQATQDATRQHDQQATQDQRSAQDTARQHTQDTSRQHDQQATQEAARQREQEAAHATTRQREQQADEERRQAKDASRQHDQQAAQDGTRQHAQQATQDQRQGQGAAQQAEAGFRAAMEDIREFNRAQQDSLDQHLAMSPAETVVFDEAFSPSEAHAGNRVDESPIILEWGRDKDMRVSGETGYLAPMREQPPAGRDEQGHRTTENEHIMPGAQLKAITTDPRTGRADFTPKIYHNAATLRWARNSALDKTHNGPDGDNARTKALKQTAASGEPINIIEDVFLPSIAKTKSAAARTGSEVTPSEIHRAAVSELQDLFAIHHAETGIVREAQARGEQQRVEQRQAAERQAAERQAAERQDAARQRDQRPR